MIGVWVSSLQKMFNLFSGFQLGTIEGVGINRVLLLLSKWMYEITNKVGHNASLYPYIVFTRSLYLITLLSYYISLYYPNPRQKTVLLQ